MPNGGRLLKALRSNASLSIGTQTFGLLVVRHAGIARSSSNPAHNRTFLRFDRFSFEFYNSTTGAVNEKAASSLGNQSGV